jgi:hypothetical protein
MMPSSEHEDLVPYLNELGAATKLGKINWKAVNPTTFVWETEVPTNARVSLQRVERLVSVGGIQRKIVNYLFQVIDLKQPAIPILSVETAGNQPLIQKFEELFELVKSGISEKTLAFLRSILPK